MVSERLSKRVRDMSFTALLRQEVGYFDMRSVGSITSQLQDDAARIQAFSGEPVRAFLVALAAVATGVILAFIVSLIELRPKHEQEGWRLTAPLVAVHVALCPASHWVRASYGIRHVDGNEENAW
jgi:ABC-type multidrug transport system fused ATPase/permease subunit